MQTARLKPLVLPVLLALVHSARRVVLCYRSGDSTARIWDLSRGRGSPLSTALPHKTDKNQQSKDVTTLDWNGDGSLLATGSYDGIARIWSRTGAVPSRCTQSASLFAPSHCFMSCSGTVVNYGLRALTPCLAVAAS